MASENDIEKALRLAVEAAGGYCLKMNPTWYRGIPDRLILLPGAVILFVELKKSKTARTKPSVAIHQSRWRKILLALGFTHLRIEGYEDLGTFKTNYL